MSLTDDLSGQMTGRTGDAARNAMEYAVTPAMPGFGKTFFVKREIMDVFLKTEDDRLIIDPEGEYKWLIRLLGGQTIRIALNSPVYINPMEINLTARNEEDKDYDPISAKCSFIVSMCELILGNHANLGKKEVSIIDEACKNVYYRYAKNPVPENMPILKDLYDELRNMKGEKQEIGMDLSIALGRYVTGSLSYFNHRSNVNINSRMVCFDLKEMDSNQRDLTMLIIQETIWDRVATNREKGRFTWVDAAQLKTLAEQAENSAGGIGYLSKNLKITEGKLNAEIAKSKAFSSNEIEALAYELQISAEDLQKLIWQHMELTENNMSQLTQQLSMDIETFRRQTGESFSTLEEEMGAGMRKLEETDQTLAQNVAEASEAAKAGLEEAKDGLQGMIDDNHATIAATGQALQEAKEEFGQGLESMQGDLAAQEARADQKMGDIHNRINRVQGSMETCQTPLLHLICKRDRENAEFAPEPYWTITAAFAEGFTAAEADTEGKAIRHMNRKEAEDSCRSCGRTGTITDCRSEIKKIKAPALFNLAEIQNTMGKKYGLKPDETLAIAQRLYETHKIISYPRTDSRYLSTDLYGEIAEHVKPCSFGKFRKYIERIDFPSFRMDKTYFNDKKVSDHHALIPTINWNTEKIYETLSENEKNFFDEIAASLIAIFFAEYQYESTTIKASVSGREFCCSGSTLVAPGFKEVYQLLKTQEKMADSEQNLPKLEEGQEVSISSLELKEGRTKPPAKYHPGNIVKLMGKYRIGTPATSANIIQTLEKRGFIVLDSKKKYTSTDLGRKFLEIVPAELQSEYLTIQFEEKLQKVNSGELSKEAFLADIYQQIQENIENIRNRAPGKKLGGAESIGNCPKCGKPVMEGKKSWYCPGYSLPSPCNFTIWKETAGKKIPAEEAKKLLANGKTNLIKGFHSSKGNTFDAYLILKEDKTVDFSFPEKRKAGRN